MSETEKQRDDMTRSVLDIYSVHGRKTQMQVNDQMDGHYKETRYNMG